MAVSLWGQTTLAVVEKKAGKVGFYSDEGQRLGEVQVGAYPHEMVFSPDRRLLYVTDNGMLWMTDKGAGGNTISIIDVKTRQKAGVIDLGSFRRPHGIAVVHGTGELIVTIENPFGLLRIDPPARKVVRSYPCTFALHIRIHSSPDIQNIGQYPYIDWRRCDHFGGCPFL